MTSTEFINKHFIYCLLLLVIDCFMSSDDHLVKELAEVVNCEVCSARDENYEKEVKAVWNAALFDKKPLAFVKVLNNDDIVKTVRFCQRNKLPLCIRNGGTSIFAQDNGAIVIALTNMNKVTVDSNNKLAEVQSGAVLADVDGATIKHQLATPLAQASYIGATGCGTLLGMAILGRSYGFTMDNIESFELITAAGETIIVNKEQHSELFWAMKGFGFNFGIVTKFWIKLHPIPSKVVAGHLYFAWENARVVLKTMRDFLHETNDNRLVLYGIISTEKERGKISIFLRYFYNGDVEKGKSFLERFVKRSVPTCASDVTLTSYDVFQKSVDDLHPFGNYYFGDAGFYYNDLTDDVIDCLVNCYNQLPCVERMSGGACYIVPMGGAYCDVQRNDSPYLYRDARFSIFNGPSTPDHSYQSQVVQWLRDTGKVLATHAIKTNQSQFDDVMSRLRHVKRQYDPGNLFRYNININPH